MGEVYIPTLWSQRCTKIPAAERADVHAEVNKRFKERTGISRTLDPKKDHDLADRWRASATRSWRRWPDRAGRQAEGPQHLE